MMRHIWAIALVLLTTSSAMAQQYDDPAVAACEVILHEGEAAPDGYMRTSSEIDNLVVRINYTTQVLNIAPRARQFECTFKVNEDGTFSPEIQIEKPEVRQCSDWVKATNNPATIAKMSPAEKAAARLELGRCNSLFEAEPQRIMGIMTRIIEPLNDLGLFSLPPEETALRNPDGE